MLEICVNGGRTLYNEGSAGTNRSNSLKATNQN